MCKLVCESNYSGTCIIRLDVEQESEVSDKPVTSKASFCITLSQCALYDMTLVKIRTFYSVLGATCSSA